jgi:metal-responsive CopG/Arc/MetJ family transcriptional regulator
MKTAISVRTMKTAISVDTRLFERAEKYAKEKKVSRSKLFSDAIREFLDNRETESLKENLNRVYSKEDSSIDPVLFKMALLSLPNEEW